MTAVKGDVETHRFYCVFLQSLYLKNIPSFPLQLHIAEVAVRLMKTWRSSLGK